MSNILFYAMTGEKLCFLHVLMNAVDLAGKGHEVKVIFEGRSVALAPQLDEEKNPLFLRAREAGLIAGVCRACAKQFGVDEKVEAIGIPLISDMMGHAGLAGYGADGYQVIGMEGRRGDGGLRVECM